MFIYPIQRILGNKLFGRVLGKYVSTKTKAADYVSIIKFTGQSKVDKLYKYCKEQQQLLKTTVIIKRKVYNLLYDKNTYKLSYEMLNKKSQNSVILTVRDMQDLKLDMSGCLLLNPNFEKFISEIINQIKGEDYKFTLLTYSNETSAMITTLTKDIIVIKAIEIILEAIYEPSFSFRQFRSSFDHKSALKDVKLKLKGAT